MSISPGMLTSAMANEDTWITGYRYDYGYFCDLYNSGKDEALSDDTLDSNGSFDTTRTSSVDSATQHQTPSERGLQRKRRYEDESSTDSSGVTPTKKPKLEPKFRPTLAVARSSVTSVKFPATQPASLRRGLSLRSEAESCGDLQKVSLVISFIFRIIFI